MKAVIGDCLKKRIKPLLPTLKERKRYLAFEVISDEKLNFNQIATSWTPSYIPVVLISTGTESFVDDDSSYVT